MYLTSLGEAFIGLSSLPSRARLFFSKVEVVQCITAQWSGAWRCSVLSFRLHMRRASAVCSPRPRSAG